MRVLVGTSLNGRRGISIARVFLSSFGRLSQINQRVLCADVIFEKENVLGGEWTSNLEDGAAYRSSLIGAGREMQSLQYRKHGPEKQLGDSVVGQKYPLDIQV